MKELNQETYFNRKRAVSLIAVCVLVFLSIPFFILDFNKLASADCTTCFTISKLGRNITTNTTWAETTNALPSQKLGFSIKITANSNTNFRNLTANDVLPSNLTYIAGSTKVDGFAVVDGITTGGINIGSLFAGQSKTITFEANIADESYFSTGQTTLTNTSNAWVIGLTVLSDTAQIIVTKQVITKPVLSITKSVDKTSANPGDEITYTLNYQNTGTASATGVVIKDPFINLNQTYLTFVSATPGADTNTTDTWTIGTLTANQSGTITIKAKISSSVPVASIEIKNRSNIDSNETSSEYSNYVSTWVYKSSQTVSLIIEKLVRNITDGTSWRSSVDADPRDEIEFSIEVKNTNNTTAQNVKVWDDLPSRLDYISGSTTIDGSYQSDGVITEGIYIGNISAYGSKIIKFKVRASYESDFYSDRTILTNYGYTRADNYHTISDTATVEVRKVESGSPDLEINKLVRNNTRGSSNWTGSVYAEPGDEVEFSIKVGSVGDKRVDDVRVSDSLPGKLEYVSGSTRVDGSYKADGIISGSGIYIGNIDRGDEVEVRFKVRVDSADRFSSGTTTLTNYGYAWGDNVAKIQDTSQVRVQKGETPSTYALSIIKWDRNVSRGQTGWVDSCLASPSQEIEFSIQVTNIGNSDLNNVRVWDTLPANMSIISNSTTIDGVSWGGDVVGSGINLGTLSRNQTKTIRFRAMILGTDYFGAGSTTLINTAYANADNVSQVYDQASVIVTKPGEVKGEEFPPTGANTIGLGFLGAFSVFISLFVYCRVREDKLLDTLNGNSNKFVKAFIKLYFRMKFFWIAMKLRFKQVYW